MNNIYMAKCLAFVMKNFQHLRYSVNLTNRFFQKDKFVFVLCVIWMWGVMMCIFLFETNLMLVQLCQSNHLPYSFSRHDPTQFYSTFSTYTLLLILLLKKSGFLYMKCSQSLRLLISMLSIYFHKLFVPNLYIT